LLDNTTLKAIGAQCELEINTKESKLRKRHVCDFLVCSLRTVMNSPPWDILGTLFVTYREESPNNYYWLKQEQGSQSFRALSWLI
jgi:hypothetical protein